MHVISQIIDGGATEADGGASAPVCPSVATPLATAWMHVRLASMCTASLGSFNLIAESILKTFGADATVRQWVFPLYDQPFLA